MKTKFENLRSDEVEINILFIIKQCIKKSWIILISALSMSAILSIGVYYKDLKSYNEIVDNMQVENGNIKLSQEDKVIVEHYQLLSDKLEQLSEYKKKSTLLNVDFNNVYRGKLVYHVVADENIKFDITCAVINFVNNGGLVEYLAQLDGFKEELYLQELISADFTGNQTEVSNSIINISVIEASKEQCEVYLNAIESAIKEYSESLVNTVGKNVLTVIQREYNASYMESVYIKQKSYLSELQVLKSELDAFELTLTDTQLASISENQQDKEVEENIIEPKKPTIELKYIIIGFLLGGIIAGVFLCISIIFNGKLQSEKELCRRLNISDLGSLVIGNIDSNNKVELISSKILLYLKNLDIKNVILIGTVNINHDIINILIENLKQKNINCQLVGNILNDASALQQITENDSIIFIEEIGVSKIKEIYEEANLCSDIKAQVMGYISVCR